MFKNILFVSSLTLGALFSLSGCESNTPGADVQCPGPGCPCAGGECDCQGGSCNLDCADVETPTRTCEFECENGADCGG